MRAKISKCYSSYKSQSKVFKLFLNFLPNGPHKTTFGMLKIENLTNFIRFVNMGPYGSENFKTLLLLQITTQSFLTSPEFPPSGRHKTPFGIFEILSFRFLTFFFQNFKFTIVAYGEIKNLNYLGSEILESRVVLQHTWGTFGLVPFKVILKSFGALLSFRNLGLYIMIRDRRKHFEWL